MKLRMVNQFMNLWREDDKAFIKIANNSFIKKSLVLYSEAQKYSDIEDKNMY